MKPREEERKRREQERLRRETEKARCAVCGKKVELEDRCQDGLYLHRDCGHSTSTLRRMDDTPRR